MDNFKVTQNNLEIVEENNYYPFGLEHKGYNNVVNCTENNHKTFQGKEYEKELERNTYDFGWRDYDPAIARWNVIDPLAESYIGISPYVYSGNNPILIGDVDGMKWKNEDDRKKGGNIISDANKTIAMSEKDIKKYDKDIESIKSNDKLSDKAKERKIQNKEQKIQIENETIGNAKLAIQAIDKIGSEDNPIEFTFNKIGGDKGYLTLGESNEIIINYIGKGNDLHEAFHAAQYSVGGMQNPTKIGQKLEHKPNRGLMNEIQAYQVQYSIYPTTIPESSKTVVKPSDIDKSFIKGIKNNPYGIN